MEGAVLILLPAARGRARQADCLELSQFFGERGLGNGETGSGKGDWGTRKCDWGKGDS
jgi:hypothetical protein